MAYTEKYVTSAASDGVGDGSSGNPWSLTDGLTNVAAGERLNIQSDSAYSIGADVWTTNAGTATSPICLRGYNSTIGDLEGQGRNADGSLNTTNFPDITLTGSGTPNDFVILQNLKFSGALSGGLFSSTARDNITLVECDFLNSQNNAAAGCVEYDNNLLIVNCDFECSGAAHGALVQNDTNIRAIGCRFKGTESSEVLLQSHYGTVIGCSFFGNGIGINCETNTSLWNIHGCLFQGLQTAIQYANAAWANLPHSVTNCIATDCAKFIDSLYSGTSNMPLVEVSNRTRDNTTPRTGIDMGVNSGEVTTDTGGAETDYTDQASDDFTPISGAPAYGASTINKRQDIGPIQHVDPVGGSGGGLKLAGTGGLAG